MKRNCTEEVEVITEGLNKMDEGVAGYYRDVRKNENGRIHVGVIFEAASVRTAENRARIWAKIKGIKDDDLVELEF